MVRSCQREHCTIDPLEFILTCSSKLRDVAQRILVALNLDKPLVEVNGEATSWVIRCGGSVRRFVTTTGRKQLFNNNISSDMILIITAKIHLGCY